MALAVEVDGIQHRTFVPAIHRTRGAFRAQVRRDRWKDRQCQKLGITLLRVPDTESLDEGAIELWLSTQLRAAGVPCRFGAAGRG